MLKKASVALILSYVLLLGVATSSAVYGVPHAQVSRAGIVGVWIRAEHEGGGTSNEQSGAAEDDTYDLRADGTYEFRASPNRQSPGNLRHSGTWRLLNGGRTLRLQATRRVVRTGERERTLRGNRVILLPIEATGGNSIRINGEEFRR